MSVTITLQADVEMVNSQGFPVIIKAGADLEFPDAIATGPFNEALDAAADQLYAMSREGFALNVAEFNRDTEINDVVYKVRYGPSSQAIYTSYNVSPSVSGSPSASASSSASASPSSSASHSSSASPSSSPSSSPSASASSSPSSSASPSA